MVSPVSFPTSVSTTGILFRLTVVNTDPKNELKTSLIPLLFVTIALVTSCNNNKTSAIMLRTLIH